LKRWQFWLGVAISAVCLWLALRGLTLGEVWATLQGANYWLLLPGIAVYFLGVWARAWRWRYLLRPLKHISTRRMFPVVATGYMGNNIYPARAGELLRIYVLRRREGVSISASLATIIVEHTFDGIVMLAFVFFNLPQLARLTADSGFVGDIQTLTIWVAGLFLGVVSVFLLMAAMPSKASRVIGWFTDRLIPHRFRMKVGEFTERFLGGLASLRSPADVLIVLGTSVVIWLFETGMYWFVMQAFTLEVNFSAMMLMNGTVNLATMIPSAPGYVGTFDATGIAVLEAYGVARSIAAGYTLVLHAALWLPITLLGAYFFTRESLSWGQVQEEMAREGTR